MCGACTRLPYSGRLAIYSETASTDGSAQPHPSERVYEIGSTQNGWSASQPLPLSQNTIFPEICRILLSSV